MKLNILEKSVLAAAIFGALATGMCAKADDVSGIQSIVQTKDVKFLEETFSKDGSRLFWRFMAYSITENLYVIVTVPAGTTPQEFGAHCTVAFDAVHYYRLGTLPNGNNVEVKNSFLTTVLQDPGVHFLGVVPNRNHTNTRWVFYVDPYNDSPGVVVNVSPACTDYMQFYNAYFTAEDAVRQYINAGKELENRKSQNQQSVSSSNI